MQMTLLMFRAHVYKGPAFGYMAPIQLHIVKTVSTGVKLCPSNKLYGIDYILRFNHQEISI